MIYRTSFAIPSPDTCILEGLDDPIDGVIETLWHIFIHTFNRNRNLRISRAPLKSQALQLIQERCHESKVFSKG